MMGFWSSESIIKRRQFIKKSLALGAVGTTAAGGWWLLNGADPARLTITHALNDLEQVVAQGWQPAGAWNLTEVFNHLAQSIEYSMTGYPEHKPQWFKSSVGAAAFQVFSFRARMSHNLTEAIPGAPTLDAQNLAAAHHRLVMALKAFESHKGGLKPHFAYGLLSHADYLKAHVMHINNHLEALRPQVTG
jgi:hypothetical protein